MILIACVDDKLGTLFNHRRQSQDRILRERILQLTDGKTLWMNEYSRKQFGDAALPQIRVSETFLQEAGKGDYCFLETVDPAPYEADLEQIILYCWNRVYPADVRFSIPLQAHGWKIVKTTDFPGSSHDNITEEVYTK